MYHHIKKLMYCVRIGAPDPRFGNMLLEQFGGANGELAAAVQYSVQGINWDRPAPKDLVVGGGAGEGGVNALARKRKSAAPPPGQRVLLIDIGTEELRHLEVVGTLARMH